MTKAEGYLVLLSEPTCLKGLVSAKSMILREITIAFTFFVLPHLRCLFCNTMPIILHFNCTCRIIQGKPHMTISSNWQDIARYKLGSPRSFHYLNQSNCFELDGVNDSHEYLATRRAMDIVGISEQEQVCNMSCF